MDQINRFNFKKLLTMASVALAGLATAQAPAADLPLVTDSVNWQTVNSPSFDFMLPTKLRGPERSVTWKNTGTKGQIQVEDGTLLLTTENGSARKQITFDRPTAGWPKDTANSLIFKLPNMPANTYRGELTLLGRESASGKNGEVEEIKVVGKTQVVWNVRDSPGWALALLALGLGLARILIRPATSDSENAPARAARMVMGVETKPDQTVTWATFWGQILVYAALLVTGFTSLYLSNEIFGAGGIADYLPLIFWGFGADLGNKTVWNVLRSPSKP